MASQLKAEPEVAAAIAAQEAKTIEKLDISVEETLREIHKIAMDVPDDNVKVREKLKALELLGKHLALFVERHELTGANGGPIKVEEQSITIGGKEVKF